MRKWINLLFDHRKISLLKNFFLYQNDIKCMTNGSTFLRLENHIIHKWIFALRFVKSADGTIYDWTQAVGDGAVLGTSTFNSERDQHTPGLSRERWRHKDMEYHIGYLRESKICFFVMLPLPGLCHASIASWASQVGSLVMRLAKSGSGGDYLTTPTLWYWLVRVLTGPSYRTLYLPSIQIMVLVQVLNKTIPIGGLLRRVSLRLNPHNIAFCIMFWYPLL